MARVAGKPNAGARRDQDEPIAEKLMNISGRPCSLNSRNLRPA